MLFQGSLPSVSSRTAWGFEDGLILVLHRSCWFWPTKADFNCQLGQINFYYTSWHTVFFPPTVAWYNNASRHSIRTGFTTGLLEEFGRSSTRPDYRSARGRYHYIQLHQEIWNGKTCQNRKILLYSYEKNASSFCPRGGGPIVLHYMKNWEYPDSQFFVCFWAVLGKILKSKRLNKGSGLLSMPKCP